MKGFIFGLLLGAAGTIACLHYTDHTDLAGIHDMLGLGGEAEEAAPAVAEEAAVEVEIEIEAAPEAEEATEEAADEAAPEADAAEEGDAAL